MNDRGAALIVVILGLALAAAAASAILLTAGGEISETRLRLEAARARALADAGVEIAAARLLSDGPVERAFAVRFEGVELAVTIEDEAGKVDLNEAAIELLEAALRAAGASAGDSARLAEAITARRNAARLRRLSELRALPGFPSDLLPPLRRFATVHSQLPGVDPREAAPELLRQIGSERHFTRSHRIAYRVLVEAAPAPSARFRRDAVLWLTPGEAEPFARLAWDEARW